MNVLDRILKRTAPEQGMPVDAQQSGESELKMNAENAANALIEMDTNGGLRYDLREYVSDAEFMKLLKEFTPRAAVRIYEAERAAAEAYQQGREDAVDEIYKRREMPRSMRSGTAAPADVDYARMSSEEFMRLKDRLARG